MPIEIKMVSVDNERSPVSGNALYVVIEQRERMVTLLHPIHLAKFDITAQEFHDGTGEHCNIWPINSSGLKFDPLKIAELMQYKMKQFAGIGRAFPQMLVRRAIAELRGCDITEVPQFKEPAPNAKPRGFAVKSDKRPGVVDAIAEELHKGASIDEIVLALKAKFPLRNADGMRTTVRCQLNRLPAKLNTKIITREDKKRGKIFQFAK